MKKKTLMKTMAATLCTTLLMTGCGGTAASTETPGEPEKNTSELSFVQIMYMDGEGNNYSMYAVDNAETKENETPSIHISYQDPEINKEGMTPNAKIMNDFDALVEKYDVQTHSSVPSDGSDTTYFNVLATYDSGKEIDMNLCGNISEKDQKMIDDFISLFKNATEQLPEKVFESKPEEGADEKAAAYINNMLGKASVSPEMLSTELVTSDVPLDSNSVLYFADLEDTTGVKKITASTSLMNTFAYHMTIIETEDGQAETVANRIKDHISWDKFVCVSPDKAFIGVDGNYVVYLLAVNDVYDALNATSLKDIPNPIATAENPFASGDTEIAEIPNVEENTKE